MTRDPHEIENEEYSARSSREIRREMYPCASNIFAGIRPHCQSANLYDPSMGFDIRGESLAFVSFSRLVNCIRYLQLCTICDQNTVN